MKWNEAKGIFFRIWEKGKMLIAMRMVVGVDSYANGIHGCWKCHILTKAFIQM